jgi:dolichol kinase
MSDEKRDAEWLKRLKDNQIAQRDPGIKVRKLGQNYTQRYRNRKVVKLGEWLGGLSHKVKGLLIGLLIAFGLWLGLASFFQGDWIDIVGIVSLILCPLLGLIIGNSFDIRDKLRDI